MEETNQNVNKDLARSAQLHYVTDNVPGIRRVTLKHGFSYRNNDGKAIKDKKELRRFKELGIPPAWQSVWICKDPQGHMQATGVDEKGRKQYRYHTKWIAASQENRFGHLLAFSNVLPEIRDKVRSDMKMHALKDQRILATIVWLLEHTYIRIGNDEYARDNKHYGLTTLRSKHVQIDNTNVMFDFVGKSGKAHSINVKNASVARTIRQLEDLPGYELFQYIDENGQRRKVASQDVNNYLKEIAGDDISAKDFRTWGGTVLSASVLHQMGNGDTEAMIKRNITEAVKQVSTHLRNTAAVCRKYYIHPLIPETYGKNTLISHIDKILNKQQTHESQLLPYEVAVVKLLEENS